MTDILDAIDNAIGCHQCGGSLDGSVSDLFCRESCQATWQARRVGAEPGPWPYEGGLGLNPAESFQRLSLAVSRFCEASGIAEVTLSAGAAADRMAALAGSLRGPWPPSGWANAFATGGAPSNDRRVTVTWSRQPAASDGVYAFGIGDVARAFDDPEGLLDGTATVDPRQRALEDSVTDTAEITATCASCGHTVPTCARCGRNDPILGGNVNGRTLCHTFSVKQPSCYSLEAGRS